MREGSLKKGKKRENSLLKDKEEQCGSEILLQIVMVSPSTHSVKNHAPGQKTTNPKLKMLEPLRYQSVHLKTDPYIFYLSILKLKYSR